MGEKYRVAIKNGANGKSIIIGFRMAWAARAYVAEVNAVPGMSAEYLGVEAEVTA